MSQTKVTMAYNSAYMLRPSALRTNPRRELQIRPERYPHSASKHKIQLEKILPRETGAVYPVCIKGKRACPPEDCGGLWGYVAILEALEDPDNEVHEELLDRVGEDLDPEHFDVAEVSFSDPDKRFKSAFG